MREVKTDVAARRLAGAVIAALAVLGTSSAYAQQGKASTPAARSPAATFEPGYVESAEGVNWRTAYGECWRAGHWSPSMAAQPCDAVARASAPARVVAAAPQPEPAPLAKPVAPAAIVAATPPLIQRITLQTDVLFAFDKAELRESGKAKLDEVAQQLKDARVEEVIAIGHTDPIGPESYNEKLSAQRAAAVKDYLVQQQGIDDAKVITEGRGESQLVTAGQCDKLKGAKLIACLQPNRRVEIELYGSREVAATETQPGTGATQPGAGATSPGSTTGSGSGSN